MHYFSFKRKTKEKEQTFELSHKNRAPNYKHYGDIGITNTRHSFFE